MKTSYGLEFKVLEAEEVTRFDGYDRTVAECQIANCGKIIVDIDYEQPIDNEYDLEEIYAVLPAHLSAPGLAKKNDMEIDTETVTPNTLL